jgi:hypothetical protein
MSMPISSAAASQRRSIGVSNRIAGAVGTCSQVIAAIDEDRNRAREDARLFQLLQEVLDEKRRHLAVLKEIGKPPPPPDPEKLKASQPTEAQHVPRAWSK